MRSVMALLKNQSRSGSVYPSRQVFEDMSSLTFEQLSNLRHRGAFTTVALTFNTCCQLVKYLSSPQSDAGERTLLDIWYQGTLDCIFSQASTTRRSAGIPAMITGILSADAERPSFDQILPKLVEIARKPVYVSETDGSNLPQVHALNCLKDIFRSSYLAYLCNTERYVPQSLDLAASCLKSEV
jgi:hypothetical protein